MKAMLPVFCRPLGYVILMLSLFIPFLLVMQGAVTDSNLLFYKECTKLLMMLGALMILLALTKHESPETDRIRVNAMRYAVFFTIIVIFGGMLYRVAVGDLISVDTSSFLTFLIMNIICLEYGIKKVTVDKLFKR
ncbi:hypothetical protein [Bacteroides ihuae]|uniref:hypothetical protein n=1 Tax=Bacteroides ihuae TaxID=1852362 RepID=UPI0008D9251F|nr:hypothetical protein [Bacteroides ihuae]